MEGKTRNAATTARVAAAATTTTINGAATDPSRAPLPVVVDAMV